MRMMIIMMVGDDEDVVQADDNDNDDADVDVEQPANNLCFMLIK